MSQLQTNFPPGESYTLRRRIVVADHGGSTDPFVVLAQIYRAPADRRRRDPLGPQR